VIAWRSFDCVPSWGAAVVSLVMVVPFVRVSVPGRVSEASQVHRGRCFPCTPDPGVNSLHSARRV
jgi:hypothetical protein